MDVGCTLDLGSGLLHPHRMLSLQ